MMSRSTTTPITPTVNGATTSMATQKFTPALTDRMKA